MSETFKAKQERYFRFTSPINLGYFRAYATIIHNKFIFPGAAWEEAFEEFQRLK